MNDQDPSGQPGSPMFLRAALRVTATVVVCGLFCAVRAGESAAPSPGVETAAGWKKFEGNPVMGGKYGTCFDVSVLREGGTYRMWLSWRPKKSVALVESPDGIHWSEPPR